MRPAPWFAVSRPSLRADRPALDLGDVMDQQGVEGHLAFTGYGGNSPLGDHDAGGSSGGNSLPASGQPSISRYSVLAGSITGAALADRSGRETGSMAGLLRTTRHFMYRANAMFLLIVAP